MSRPLRIEFPGAVYHLMNRGAARRQIFLDERDCAVFLETVAETHELWRVDVFAYAVMGNHYHLCLRTPEGNLSRVMRHLDGIYTQRFNRRHKRDGPLFRGRYKGILVDSDAYLAAVVRYIHLNPVEARMVQAPEDHAWSSHHDYLSRGKVAPWLDLKEVMGRFKDRREFHEFVLSGNEEAIKEYYGRPRQSPVLGGEGFLEWVRGLRGALSREHPRYERVGVRPTATAVVRGVADSYGVSGEAILQGRRGRESEGRKVGMYLVKRICDLTLQETAERFGVRSYGVVGWASHFVRQRMASDSRFRKKVEKIQAIIYQQKI